MAAGTIVSLTGGNFHAGRDGRTLSTTITQPIIVSFEQDHCDKCVKLRPIYAKLASEVRGMMFGVINVKQHPAVVRMSQVTNMPIGFTPTIAIFCNGIAYLKYEGNRNYASLKSFVNKATSMIQAEQKSPSFVHSPPSGSPYGQAPPQQGYSQQPPYGGGHQPHPPPQPMKYKGVEDEDVARMLTPDMITPYNTPWENPA